MHPQSLQADRPPASRFKLERARCKTPVLPFQTVCVLATGAWAGEVSCDLQTPAQPSTAPACADSSNTVFSLLGAASKHYPDHAPLSNHWSGPVAQQARIQETVLASTFQSECWSTISSLLGIGQKSPVSVFSAGKDWQFLAREINFRVCEWGNGRMTLKHTLMVRNIHHLLNLCCFRIPKSS